MRELRWLNKNSERKIIEYVVTDKKTGKYNLIPLNSKTKEEFVLNLAVGLQWLQDKSRKTNLGDVESILHGSHTGLS